MSKNSVSDAKTPDNVVKMRLGATTYEVREFFGGVKALDEIVTERIIHEAQKCAPTSLQPSVLQPENA